MHYAVINKAGEQIAPNFAIFLHAREYADLCRKESVARGGDEHYNILETRHVYTTSTLGEALAEK